jgi:hypothetical protein
MRRPSADHLAAWIRLSLDILLARNLTRMRFPLHGRLYVTDGTKKASTPHHKKITLGSEPLCH